VTPESPAAKGGVLPGDLIYKMGSAWVRRQSDVTKWAAVAKPDVQASVFLFRKGAKDWERKKLTVVPMSAAAREQATKVRFTENSKAAQLHGLATAATDEARQTIKEILAEREPTPELMIAACDLLRNPDVDIRADAIHAGGAPVGCRQLPRTSAKARIQAGWAGQAGAVTKWPSVWALSIVSAGVT